MHTIPAEPARVLAGIGSRRLTDPQEIIALVGQCLEEAGMPLATLVALASHARKAGDPALLAAADGLGVPLRLLDGHALRAAVPTPSSVVERHTGLPSIAEACALAAGTLLLPKRQTARVTCALALCRPSWQLDRFGQPAPQPASAATQASTSATSRAGG
ncbi:cobalamin biosynthesis protein [Devosia sp. 1566]|uniref:cobalamin biosynthesis protein n=1 Tax=Devosia sp. 1566 TaxID=2499144 RepID=UPI0020C13A71|nr:cobalamin biosynthesis protein [Devosia sp. 1566]